MAKTNDLTDQFGKDLAVGDVVVRTAIDRGAPAWATRGTVVGFTPTKIEVEWVDTRYDYRVDADPKFAFTKPHRCDPAVVRVIGHNRCTCGAQTYPGCFCDLTPAQWLAAHPDRPIA